MKYLILWVCLGVALACEFKRGNFKATKKEGEKWTYFDMHYECKNGKVETTGCRTPKGTELKVGERTYEDDGWRERNGMHCTKGGLMVDK
ncbi:hypothetical protein OSTOST_01669 [Ostertagia ostertagi]